MKVPYYLYRKFFFSFSLFLEGGGGKHDRIPKQEMRNCISKFEALFKEWKQKKKTPWESSETCKKDEADFKRKLEDLIDIAHAKVFVMITIEENKQFLTKSATGIQLRN